MSNTAGDQGQQLEIVRDMFARDRDGAWQLAHYQSGRRDEVTARIRFALAALNGASAVAVLTMFGILPIENLTRPDAILALFVYVAGLGLSGASLYLQEGHLTFLAGQAYARARSLDSCVSAM